MRLQVSQQSLRFQMKKRTNIHNEETIGLVHASAILYGNTKRSCPATIAPGV